MIEIYWEYLGVSESLQAVEQSFHRKLLFSVLLHEERELDGFVATYDCLVSSGLCGVAFTFSICVL